jgi:hypothetical protein
MNTVKRIALAAAVPAVLAIGAAPASATAGSPNAANSTRQSIAWVPPNWTVIVDDTHTISIAAPSTWTDVDTVPLRSDAGTPGPWISATTQQDLMFPADGVADTFSVPGVVFTAAPYAADTASMLAAAAEHYGLCTAEPLGTFDNGQYAGHIQIFSACGGTASRVVHVAANPPDAAFTAVLLVQLTGAPDDEATLNGFLHSFGRLDEGR